MAKFLTDSKRLNVAIILSSITYGFIIFVGVIYAILGTFMPYHIAFTGKTESDIKAYSSELMLLISIFIRLFGFSFICIGITGLFVINFAFRKREKWAWLLSLISGGISYVPNLILTYTVLGSGLFYLINVTMGLLWILTLTISYKEFFK